MNRLLRKSDSDRFDLPHASCSISTAKVPGKALAEVTSSFIVQMSAYSIAPPSHRLPCLYRRAIYREIKAVSVAKGPCVRLYQSETRFRDFSSRVQPIACLEETYNLRLPMRLCPCQELRLSSSSSAAVKTSRTRTILARPLAQRNTLPNKACHHIQHCPGAGLGGSDIVLFL
jgi:hypothetical protein